ncbi:phasin family protein [Noviherbaspirillum sedimenti]|uniref:Phasin family protein n=1 Tax=Noviherbaspirillum sedimenti TaxID=2320865 RepID=A0A3A3GBP4_9BURK|nr:phasin family protein [Noviherbaspirillum sedimenti]RJG04092.1 phasin family protein [Noviherbaspirillum sedimenti]
MPNLNVQTMLNPMAAMYQTQLEASRRVADTFFSGVQKMDHVMLEASHRACIEQLRFAQSLVAVRDAQGAASAQARYFSQRPERTMDYQRELIRVFNEVQSEVGKSMQNYMAQLGGGAMTEFATALAPERESGEAPPSAIPLTPMTGLFSAWQSAFQEAAAVANRNIEAARTTFENAAHNAYVNANEAIDETAEAMAGGRERKATTSGGHHSGSKRK